MKVFVTGASGFIGSAVVKELLANKHQVVGLARSEESGAKITALGAEAYHADLSDPESLKPAVLASDAVVHLGFIHDFSRFKEMCKLDKKVIETIGSALIGTQKPFIITSAIGIIKKSGIITETDIAENSPNPRVATEKAADKLAELGIRVSVVRLAPVVHDHGDQHGFIPSLIRLASEKGISGYINEGTNLWPAVHRQDVANLYLLALEKNAPIGIRYHAVAEQGIEFKKIAEIVAKQLHISAVSVDKDQAENHFTWFTHFARFDIMASAQATCQALEWQPINSTLMEDLEGTAYFPLA